MIKVPPGVQWPIHRVAISGRYNDSLQTISTEWSVRDLWDAIAILDAIEEAK
jgi:hypothetical protein